MDGTGHDDRRARAGTSRHSGVMVQAGTGRPDVRSYFRLPLPEDQRDTVTLLRVEPAAEDRVRIHLHRGVNRTAFGARFSGAAPDWRAVAEPTLTLLAPARATPGLLPEEAVLADVGALLAALDDFHARIALTDDEIYPWPFGDLLPNVQWLMHLRQLATLHERVAGARGSTVFDDPRVQARVQELARAATPHADALRGWLARAAAQLEDVRGAVEAEMHERRVQAVLAALAGSTDEDPRIRTNPELPRISSRRAPGRPG